MRTTNKRTCPKEGQNGTCKTSVDCRACGRCIHHDCDCIRCMGPINSGHFHLIRREDAKPGQECDTCFQCDEHCRCRKGRVNGVTYLPAPAEPETPDPAVLQPPPPWTPPVAHATRKA